jgi:catechol 2,3-dioxygenase-like lactoylglutathione lyase family enzyme
MNIAPKTATATPLDTKLEVVVIPVADAERSKRFYEGLGWRVDADFSNGDTWRALQLTPPGSECSVIFGKGVTTTAPGSAQGLFLVVDDIAAARIELVARGVDVSEIFHFEGPLTMIGTNGRAPGPDPKGKPYSSWASFSDPDGNGWLLQEVKARLPGRGLKHDLATLTSLLREAEELHGAYEAAAPKHHWSGWYAAYVIERERGGTHDEASKRAALHVDAMLRSEKARP